MTGLFLRLLRDVRLVPIVLIATIALFALKALGLVLDGGYLFDNAAAASDPADNMEVTGTITPPKPAAPPARRIARRAEASSPGPSRCSTFPMARPGRVDAELPADPRSPVRSARRQARPT